MQNGKQIKHLLPAHYVSASFWLDVLLFNSHNSEIIIIIISVLWNRKLKVRHREAKPPALSNVSDRARVPTPVSSPLSCTKDVELSLITVVLHLVPALKQMHVSVSVRVVPKWLCGPKNASEQYRICWNFRRQRAAGVGMGALFFSF